MEQININSEMAYKCATALVYKHNSIARTTENDNLILVSFRSLYRDLCSLGQEHMIASAIRPVNPKNLPLFI